MERNLDPVDDPRVKFKPDGWQIKVLDALNEHRSVFVVAPTSSGKTFIAYYAMEKILRADNDGVLVYIAPTKALVNQIAAELQTRFDKKYKDAHTVWAIYTRDYRINNPQKCQILVTVPHVFQILLFSPALTCSWSPRVKRIILDEVHCIGKADNGVVWEQILLLAPCPIIALSATVGNPVQFHKWLQITQNTIVRQKPSKGSSSEGIARGITVELIHHRHRYNDLRKFRYSIAIQHPTNFIDHGRVFGGLDKVPVGTHLGIPNLDVIPRFQFIQPIAALCESDDHLPDDLVLESRDCYTLWCAMVSVQNAKYPVPKDLEPSSASFPEIINKVDVIKWGRH
ncbi:P-loop containing nucleoside triphosphate hydrolase protein [Terfezia claveryi]|nr:P-loop containing nucleoside triphosphate hydrolase protein [Terfezia claveryi]